MKRLLLAAAATLGLCASGLPAHAGPDYVSGDDYQRPARREYREERRVVEEPRTYIPLLPPLPFLPVPTLVVGGHGPAPAIVPIGGPSIVAGVGPGYYGRPYHRRRFYRRGYPYGYYGGPGVRVGVGF